MDASADGAKRDSSEVEGESLVRGLIAELLDCYPPSSTPTREFLRARYDAGLAWLWFPPGYGGLGLSPSLQTLTDREFAAAGAPNTTVGSIGYMMAGSAIVTYGSEEMKRRYLPMIFAHEADWVQLFSEPGAGSDLAGLSTRAVRDGDEWVINGQKVWSSGAMRADYGLLITRSDPDVPKYNGLTAFIIDMHAPGVEVRPLRNMMGTAEFAETFFNDLRVPDESRLGGVNDGWRVTLSTLMVERVNFTADFAGAGAPRSDGPMAEATRDFLQRGPDVPGRRDEFIKVWTAVQVGRFHNQRVAQAAKTGIPGPEGSIGKLLSTELTKKVANLAIAIRGPEGMILSQPYPTIGESRVREDLDPVLALLTSPSNTIMGGTSEIQRNNIGERVLGLPREPRMDRDIPWKDVPR